MEIIDLLSGFDLDHLKDKDLQNLAKGLAVTFIEKPLNTFDGTVPDESSESQMMTAVSAAFIKYMKKALEGGVFDKISMVASVTKNIAAGKSLRDCSDTPLDPSGFVKLVEAKHLHALSENDYHEISMSLSHLLLDEGPLSMMKEHHIRLEAHSLKTVTVSAADRIYTGLKMALAEKDSLIQAAEESKQRHSS